MTPSLVAAISSASLRSRSSLVIAGARLHNLKNRPLYICAGEQDTLYPISFVRTFVKKMREFGIELTFRTFEEYSHSSGYVVECEDELREWFVSKKRNPWSNTLEYTASDLRFGRCDWIEILEIGKNEKPCNVPDSTITFLLSVSLGISLDRRYTGKGLRIAKVAKDSNAFNIGMKPGDIILTYNEKAVENVQRLVKVLKEVKEGKTKSLEELIEELNLEREI